MLFPSTLVGTKVFYSALGLAFLFRTVVLSSLSPSISWRRRRECAQAQAQPPLDYYEEEDSLVHRSVLLFVLRIIRVGLKIVSRP